ncbi:MAG: glutamine-hydrolyzing GMP synthase [Halothiobacillaceae bacterium]
MNQSIHAERILILDFGSPYTQLIARRVRESHVYCEIHSWDVDDAFVQGFAPTGIILSGGPEAAIDPQHPPRAPELIFALDVPVLGIGYGMQTMATQLGGKVESVDQQEFGFAKVRARGHTALLKNIEDEVTEEGFGMLDVWMDHGDQVVELPEGFKLMASSDTIPIAGMADESRQFFGLQFHPEVEHTRQGARIIERFVRDICGTQGLWRSDAIIEAMIEQVQEQVGNDEVVLGLSGGVDSSVVAALLHRAIGDRLTCIFVDTGLLREGEGDQVMRTFAEHLGVRVIRVDARNRFLDRLAGELDPEEKRKIIGNTFIDIFDEEASQRENAQWLAQGTIYPDVIESAGSKTGKAQPIKSHHNVGGLPEHMKLGLVEPLRQLFKDEVRQIGLELGLPSEMIMRHPFPGPGLGVRILGEVKAQYADLLRRADAIFIDELREAGLYDKVSQAFAVFLPIRSVGVVDGGRRYDYVIALRAVETIDFMTARWARLPQEFLEKVSLRIVNEVNGISRVVYDITGKPPGTIEWE